MTEYDFLEYEVTHPGVQYIRLPDLYCVVTKSHNIAYFYADKGVPGMVVNISFDATQQYSTAICTDDFIRCIEMIHFLFTTY